MQITLENIDRTAGPVDSAGSGKSASRSTRYKFGKVGLIDLKVLKIELEMVGARSRDTIYKALCEHIAQREQSEARSKSAFRRCKREGRL